MISSICVVLVLSMSLVANTDYAKSYAKHQLWRLRATNDEQIVKLATFKQIAHQHDIDFWSEHLTIHTPVSSYSNANSFYET